MHVAGDRGAADADGQANSALQPAMRLPPRVAATQAVQVRHLPLAAESSSASCMLHLLPCCNVRSCCLPSATTRLRHSQTRTRLQYRRMGAWPLSMAGLLDMRPALRVMLFRTYTEKASAPFVVFRAVLHPRAGGLPPPPITGAELHISLRLGVVRWLLSWVRHGECISGLHDAFAQICTYGWNTMQESDPPHPASAALYCPPSRHPSVEPSSGVTFMTT